MAKSNTLMQQLVTKDQLQAEPVKVLQGAIDTLLPHLGSMNRKPLERGFYSVNFDHLEQGAGRKHLAHSALWQRLPCELPLDGYSALPEETRQRWEFAEDQCVHVQAGSMRIFGLDRRGLIWAEVDYFSPYFPLHLRSQPIDHYAETLKLGRYRTPTQALRQFDLVTLMMGFHTWAEAWAQRRRDLATEASGVNHDFHTVFAALCRQ